MFAGYTVWYKQDNCQQRSRENLTNNNTPVYSVIWVQIID